MSLNRAVAYKGAIGRRRESWCIDYTAYKREQIAGVEADLRREVDGAGQAIACHRGCSECCSAYVVASLQECEAIVYYVYHHQAVLDNYLASYREWGQKIAGAQELADRIYRLQGLALSSPTTPEERAPLYEALSDYMSRGIYCPFLKDGACSIYEVRPFVCAGVVVSSPSEWCRSAHPRHGDVALFKADAHFENDKKYFLELKNNVTYGCMAFMVYTLLRGGYGTLSAMPGLEGLKDDVYRDPEVKAALGAAGSPNPEASR